MSKIFKEFENLDNKPSIDDNKDEVSNKLTADIKDFDDKLKIILDQRNKLQEELEEANRAKDETHRRIKKQRTQIDVLRRDDTEINTPNGENKKIIAQIEKEIQEAEDEFERVRIKVDGLEIKITERDAEINKLNKSIDDYNR